MISQPLLGSNPSGVVGHGVGITPPPGLSQAKMLPPSSLPTVGPNHTASTTTGMTFHNQWTRHSYCKGGGSSILNTNANLGTQHTPKLCKTTSSIDIFWYQRIRGYYDSMMMLSSSTYIYPMNCKYITISFLSFHSHSAIVSKYCEKYQLQGYFEAKFEFSAARFGYCKCKGFSQTWVA